VACHNVLSARDRLFPAWHHIQSVVELHDTSWFVNRTMVTV
jgi:hypothetical protein